MNYETVYKKLCHQLGKSKMKRQRKNFSKCGVKEDQERILQEVKVELSLKSDY